MKRILSICILLCVALSLSAQNPILNFINKTDSSRISFDYSFKMRNKAKLVGSGSVILQGKDYKMQGNGLDVYCNGVTRWILDYAEKEIAIENVDETTTDVFSNPAVLINKAQDNFKFGNVYDSQFNGKKVKAYDLQPIRKGDIMSMQFFFSGNNLVGLTVMMKDNSITDISLTNMKIQPLSNIKDFEFNVKSLDSSWIVSDLR